VETKEDWLDKQIDVWLDYIMSNNEEMLLGEAFSNYWRGILLPIWLIRIIWRKRFSKKVAQKEGDYD